jgi:hypothetical protein
LWDKIELEIESAENANDRIQLANSDSHKNADDYEEFINKAESHRRTVNIKKLKDSSSFFEGFKGAFKEYFDSLFPKIRVILKIN